MTFLFALWIPLFLWSQPGNSISSQENYFVIWNVGQGQWTTLVNADVCIHVDVGGETLIHLKNNLSKLCKHKKNRVYLTHWDWDHISFTRFLFESYPEVCLARGPAVLTKDRGKLSLIKSLKICPLNGEATPVLDLNKNNPLYGHLINKRNSNQSSQVFYLSSAKILIPGDSPSSQEKIWMRNSELPKTTGLVLGHHGSRTSTSEELLNHLKNLVWAVCSSRKQKYGHPSADVVVRLHQKRTPLLSTEIWGNIIFEL